MEVFYCILFYQGVKFGDIVLETYNSFGLEILDKYVKFYQSDVIALEDS